MRGVRLADLAFLLCSLYLLYVPLSRLAVFAVT
jgi:hypothetical protein